jgi:hypothetical protein
MPEADVRLEVVIIPPDVPAHLGEVEEGAQYMFGSGERELGWGVLAPGPFDQKGGKKFRPKRCDVEQP